MRNSVLKAVALFAAMLICGQAQAQCGSGCGQAINMGGGYGCDSGCQGALTTHMTTHFTQAITNQEAMGLWSGYCSGDPMMIEVPTRSGCSLFGKLRGKFGGNGGCGLRGNWAAKVATLVLVLDRWVAEAVVFSRDAADEVRD